MLQLYKNIKERRTELHLTQSELADKMGYADVYKRQASYLYLYLNFFPALFAPDKHALTYCDIFMYYEILSAVRTNIPLSFCGYLDIFLHLSLIHI